MRTAEHGCCEWCSKLAGEYIYPDVPDNVYKRHANCRCSVEYDPGSGKRQDVWTKRWTDGQDRDILEKRKQIGQRTIAQDLTEHPGKFASYTPQSLKEALEAEGFDVKPLSGGNLKGILFENGGGYKVNFDGDGLLQYHPEARSHHDGAYYKISTGKGGRKRYDLDGNLKTD